MSKPEEELQHQDIKELPREHVEVDDVVHKRLMEGATAQELAAEGLHIDQERADQLRAELQASRQGGFVPLTAFERKMNRRVNLKHDLFIVPFCAIVYMFNQLDRSNLGNAQTANFAEDLGIDPAAVNTAASLFFITYVPFQPVAASIAKRLGVTRSMGVMCIAWGVVTICQAFIKTKAQLYAIRLLVGITETGFFTSCVAYMSNFYPRYELAWRISLFFGCFSIGSALGGLIAYGSFQINGNLHPWQYLFIIEGTVPLGLGIAMPFWLPLEPKSSWYLSPEEKDFADKRMVIDAAGNLDASHKLTKRDIWEAIIDWRLWIQALSCTLSGIATNGFTIFFPLVVKGLGYSGAIANLMTVPPYILATIILWVLSWFSDKYKNRVIPIEIGLLLVVIGFLMSITIPLDNLGGRYAALLMCISGAFVASPLNVTWLAGNTPDQGKRVVIIGINGWSNISGVFGSQLFIPKFAPDYLVPLKVTLGLICASMLSFAVTAVLLAYVNRKRAKILSNMTAQEIEEENTSNKRLGDRKYTFVYGL